MIDRELIENFRSYLVRCTTELVKNKDEQSRMIESIKLASSDIKLEQLAEELDQIIDKQADEK